MLYTAHYDAPVGMLTLAGDGRYLTGLWIEGQKYFLASLTELPETVDDLPVFKQVKAWLDAYFAGERPTPENLPLKPEGTAFQRSVWARLKEIPYGQVSTYGALAERLGTASARAVGGAVGHNPISIILPCHRVVGAHGSLVGYAGGLDKKRWLLAHEGVEL
ncbi:methylated-DNA--[protein]-cysteine S-methyltransferase [Vermiculatibacterium agrestimuris]|uniref:methylated-DNA--[protein]-cysteine S-methyltransferase n=1 Tax=Vermiculatibacterium agrestimuris TaxID=2941519 RepID=UPI00203D81F6|nr:methylated-DNA--[protein]-cysteine S-methyltransferase [Vermiculatibacterium agrestimuris]